MAFVGPSEIILKVMLCRTEPLLVAESVIHGHGKLKSEDWIRGSSSKLDKTEVVRFQVGGDVSIDDLPKVTGELVTVSRALLQLEISKNCPIAASCPKVIIRPHWWGLSQRSPGGCFSNPLGALGGFWSMSPDRRRCPSVIHGIYDDFERP